MSALRHPLWLVVCGLGITQIIGWGTTYYALGALSQDIIATTGWPPLLVFGAFSLSLLVSGIISRAAGRIIDERGGRQTMLAGSLLSSLGCLILGAFAHPAGYVLGWLILAPAMRLATYDAAFTSLSQMAGEKTRISISYLSLFGGLASTVFWPLGHFLSGQFGWQATFLIYAALHLLVCAPLHLRLLSSAPVAKAQDLEEEPAGLEGPDRRLAMAVFAFVLASNGFVFASISAHVLPLFEGLGLAAASAVSLSALIGPSQVMSRIAEIIFGRRWSPTQLGLLAFGLLPAGLAAAAAGGFSLHALIAFAVIYGMSNGLVTIAKGAYPLALFGRRNYGEVLGTLTMPSLVLNALAPLLMAQLLQAWGPARSLLACLAVGLSSLLAMAWLARRYPA
jgi:MFS family permease